MARGLRPARPGGSLSTLLEGGGRRPHHGGSEGRLLLKRPRPSRRRASWRPKEVPSRGRRKWWSRGLAFFVSGGGGVVSLFFCSHAVGRFLFPFSVRRTGEEIYGILPLRPRKLVGGSETGIPGEKLFAPRGQRQAAAIALVRCM